MMFTIIHYFVACWKLEVLVHWMMSLELTALEDSRLILLCTVHHKIMTHSKDSFRCLILSTAGPRTLRYGVEKSGLSLDVNARSASGYTPLHLAAMHGHKNMLRLLVGKFQADVNRRDNAGKKPWQYLSSSTGCTSREVWQLLGATPPSPNSRDGGGGGGGAKVAREQQQQQQRQRRKHHFSSASSGERPTVIPSSRVKRSTSLAAFLKHKTMQRFQGHQSDSSL